MWLIKNTKALFNDNNCNLNFEVKNDRTILFLRLIFLEGRLLLFLRLSVRYWKDVAALKKKQLHLNFPSYRYAVTSKKFHPYVLAKSTSTQYYNFYHYGWKDITLFHVASTTPSHAVNYVMVLGNASTSFFYQQNGCHNIIIDRLFMASFSVWDPTRLKKWITIEKILF